MIAHLPSKKYWLRLMLALAGALLLAACNQPAPPAANTGVYKIRIERDGVYRLTRAQLPGLAAADFTPDRLALTRNGAPVPFSLLGDGADKALFFYGQGLADDYAAYEVYWLHVQSAATDKPTGPQLGSRDVQAMAAAPVANTLTTVRAEEDKIYVPKGPPAGEHWQWQQLRAPITTTVTVNLEQMVDISATLRVSLWGSTQTSENPDHHVRLLLNDQQVADEAWDGAGRHVISATLSTGVLREGANAVTIAVPGDTGAVVDSAVLDWVEITYLRKMTVQGDQMAWQATAGQADFKLTGFSTDNLLLWDVSEPMTPTLLNGFTTAKNEGGFALRFHDNEASGRRYLALAPAQALTPASVTTWQGTDLRLDAAGADYIIITPPEFAAAIQPLAEQRQADGLRVLVANRDDVFDSFSNGRPSPIAIRDFLRHAYDNWPAPAPRFVLLVGDASYDYRDRLNGKFKNILPTYLLDTTYVGETASDNWLVSFGGEDDYRPSMAIGRLPAQNVEQLEAMVKKTLAYESAPPSGDWRRRVLLVADDDDQAFAQMSDTLATDYLSKTYTIDKVYIGQTPDANASVLKTFNEGVSMVNYVGHGSLDVWGAEKALQSADLAKMTSNGGRLPLLVTMTCLTGFFHHPTADSLGEVLLRAPDKGIVAALVPTSESVTSQQEPLADAFYRELLTVQNATVGEAMLRAKQSMPDNGKAYRDVMETFNLLGDPALRLVAPTAETASQ